MDESIINKSCYWYIDERHQSYKRIIMCLGHCIRYNHQCEIGNHMLRNTSHTLLCYDKGLNHHSTKQHNTPQTVSGPAEL